jgi:signal transduction histidine kinase
MTITYFKYLLFTALLLCANAGRAQQPDTLFLSGIETKIDLLPHVKFISSPDNLSPTAALALISQHGFRLAEATIGFTRNVYWGAFIIKNNSSTAISYLLELENPQIDSLQTYIYSGDSITPWVLTGDKFPFTKRALSHRNFIFPIKLTSGESKAVLLKINKRNSSVNFPLNLWKDTFFYEKDSLANLGYGLYFGLTALCALYSVLIFAFLRTSIYLWYFIWIISSAVFVSTGLGFSHQFLYPHATDANSIFRVIIQVINLIAFLKFSQKFLQMEVYTPKVGDAIHYIALFITFLTLPLPFKPTVYFTYSHFLLPFLNWLMIITLALIIYSAGKSYKQQRITITYYFAAFAALIIGVLATVAIEFGVIEAKSFPADPFLMGSALEYLIFSIGLTYQIKKVFDERNDLTLKFAQQQKELLKAYVDGVEKERERISQELHDNIGSRLSTLNRFTSSGSTAENTKLQEQIEILCDDVRNMSHQLSPSALKMAGLKSKIFELAGELEKTNNLKIDIQFYDFDDTLEEEKAVHIYRILQEAFNNIAKHAKATLVDLQFFGHSDELVITLEDNGIGFREMRTGGIGIQNMQARAASLRGILEVSSLPGKGTQLLIRIPQEK